MAGAELALAIVGTVDLCIKYGQKLLDKYKTFKAAETEIGDKVIYIEASWSQIAQQLSFLKRIWDTLEEEHQQVQDRVIRVLSRKLEDAVSQISKLDENRSGTDEQSIVGKRRRLKYAFYIKEALDHSIQELDKWRNMFNPTWYLILRISDRVIDKELVRETGKLSTARRLRISLQDETQGKATVFLPKERLDSAQLSVIPLSTSQIADIPGVGRVMLDSVDCGSIPNQSAFERDVRDLGRKLQQTSPSEFHLLNCLGVVKNKDPATRTFISCDFVFRIPDGCGQPQSLRSFLLSEANHSLSDRVRLAKELATSLSYVHTLQFVHKNVRPETVLLFPTASGWSLFLAGFKSFRTADGKTLRLGDNAWEKNIYRHPDRQGLHPDADYIMQHDIYSLGVCLLEIGLWESFVTYRQTTTVSNRTLAEASQEHPELRNDGSSKDHLVALAKQRLPQRMGDKYTQVVVNCLTCMDPDNLDFGDQTEFEDDDGVLIGVRYIEKIFFQIEAISV